MYSCMNGSLVSVWRTKPVFFLILSLGTCFVFPHVTSTIPPVTTYHALHTVGLSTQAVTLYEDCVLTASYVHDTWTSWSTCEVNQNDVNGCSGTYTRTRDCLDVNDTVVPNKHCSGARKEIGVCYFDIDGDWSSWGSWTCTSFYNGTRERTRSCDNPVKCNNGLDCTGDNLETEENVFIDGGWAAWSTWSSCSVTMGHGVSTRFRGCNNPEPCRGLLCEGDFNETIPCEIIPKAFSGSVFGNNHMMVNETLVFYSFANVHIFPTAQLKPSYPGYREWDLYKVDLESGNETLVDSRRNNKVSFKITPGSMEDGLHKLYLHFAYYQYSPYYITGWIYIESIYPPPRVFIQGGSGRVSGPGTIKFDARSGSYDLLLGPGHPENLYFNWSCHEFPTSSLDDLIQINVKPEYIFVDEGIQEEISWSKWYSIVDYTVWAISSKLLNNVLAISRSARDYDFNYLSSFLEDPANPSCNKVLNNLVQCPVLLNGSETCLTYSLGVFTCVDNHLRNHFCYNNPGRPVECPGLTVRGVNQSCIDYLKDSCDLQSEYTTKDWNATEYTYYLETMIYDFSFVGSIRELQTEFEARSQYLKAGAMAFKYRLDKQTINETETVASLLSTASEHLSSLSNETITVDSCACQYGSTNDSGFAEFITTCFHRYSSGGIRMLTNALYGHLEKLQDIYSELALVYTLEADTARLTKIYEDLFSKTLCPAFEGNSFGYAEIEVNDTAVTNRSIGYIITVRANVNNSNSYMYFQQSLQVQQPLNLTDPRHPSNGGIPKLDIECRLNCKQKVASKNVMSLRARCDTCSFSDIRSAEYKWTLQEIDVYYRETSNLTGWTTGLETDINSNKFVLKGETLSPGKHYLITAYMFLRNGETSVSILMIETTQPPYSNRQNKCEMGKTHYSNSVEITLYGWMDEGFRETRNAALDWKEQLTFRVMQRDERTNRSTLLYYGGEKTLSNITLNEGYEEDNYYVEVYIQIFDTFDEYADCVLKHVQIIPLPMESLTASVSDVEGAYLSGNVKVLSMITETTANSIVKSEQFRQPVSDDPSQWINIGTSDFLESIGENSTDTITFEDILNTLTPQENETEKEMYSETLKEFSKFLTQSIENLEMVDVASLRKNTHALGTLISNKELAEDEMLVSSLNSSEYIVGKLRKFQTAAMFPVYEEYYSAADDLVRTLDKALNGIVPILNTDTPTSVQTYDLQKDLQFQSEFNPTPSNFTSAERAFMMSLLTSDYQRNLDHSKNLTRSVVSQTEQLVLDLGSVLDDISYRKQLPIYVQQTDLTTSLNQINNYDLPYEEIKVNDIGVKLEPLTNNSVQDQSIQVSLFTKTPYVFDDESKRISSDTVVVNILNETRNAPTTIRMRNKNSIADGKDVLLAFSKNPDEPIEQVFFTKTYWKAPFDQLYLRIETSSADTQHLNHKIYVRRDVGPTATEFDWWTSVSTSNWTNDSVTVVVPGGMCDSPCVVYSAVQIFSDKGISTINGSQSSLWTGNSTGNYTGSFTGNSTGNYTGSFSGRRRRRKRSTTEVISYSVKTWTSGCLVLNPATNTWDRSSCIPTSASSIDETVCYCPSPPGNTYASTFYVPPNTIDFSSVFRKFDIVNNGAVFGTVIALILLHLLLAVWARRKDKQDVIKGEISYLADNLKVDDYVYVITVVTGLSRHSGTKSNVSFIMTSDTRETGVRHLEDGLHKGFETGSVRRFVMTTPKSIGDIRYMNIWHDNSGKSNEASWNLKTLQIEDVQTGERFTFICNDWLTLDTDTGRIQKAIPVADPSNLQSFSFNFKEKTRENTAENHLWISVLVRPEKNGFTRLQRLSCCFALLFLAMITNAMFFGQDNSVDQMKFGPVSFSLSGIYVSVISIAITSPPIILTTFIFKHSKGKETREGHSGEDNGKHIRPADKQIFPCWCIYIAWTLTILAILVSGFFVILYSMEWGKHKSEEWLKCFFLSWMESLLLIDPIKVIAISTILAFCLKKVKKDKEPLYNKEEMLREAKERAVTSVRSMIESPSLGIIMDDQQIHDLRQQRKAEMKTTRILLEVIAYMLMLAIIYIISYSNRDPRSFQERHNIDYHLLKNGIVNASKQSIRFSQVSTVDQYYDWIRDTLLPFVFPEDHYNGVKMTPQERSFISDQVNYRVGPLKLRQLRAKEVECLVPIMADLQCYDHYFVLNEDTTDYCEGWTTQNCSQYLTLDHLSLEAWKFTSSSSIWGMPVTGEIATYGGGGYIAELGVNLGLSNMILNDLYKHEWIDRKTRAVMVEFTLYNTNVNLFTYFCLMAEFPEFGGIITRNFVTIFRTYQHLGDYGVFVFICELVFATAVLILSIKMAIEIFKRRRNFFREAWKVFDFIILLLTLVAIAVYIARAVFADMTINEFLKNKYKAVNFAHVATWDEALSALTAFLVALVTIRLMRVLSYSKRLTEIISVLSHGSKDLAGVFLMFFIVFFAYVCIGYLVFGRILTNYRNLFVASTTIVNAIIGKNNIEGLLGASPVIAQAYYFTFVLFVMWILMTMLNATLNRSITAVRDERFLNRDKVHTYGIDDLVKQSFLDATASLLSLFGAQKKNRPMTSITARDIDIEVEDLCNEDTVSMNDDSVSGHKKTEGWKSSEENVDIVEKEPEFSSHYLHP